MPRNELANGPIANRSCTDILCCLIFVAFVVALVGVGAYGVANGKPANLLTTFDFDGKRCGQEPGYEDYKMMYFPSFNISSAQTLATSVQSGTPNYKAMNDMFQYAVCVKTCPKKADPAVACKEPSFMKGSEYYKDCIWYPATTAFPEVKATYDTQPVLGKFCIPTPDGQLT